MSELLASGMPCSPFSCPCARFAERRAGKVVKDRRQTCVLSNNLRVAIEVDLGQGAGWQVLYPTASLQSAPQDHPASARLRDDPAVCGRCPLVRGVHVLSEHFGDFSTKAAEYIRKEEEAAWLESQRRKKRQEENDRRLSAEVGRSMVRRQRWAIMWISLFILIILSAMLAVASFAPENQPQAMGIGAAFLGLWCCACVGKAGLFAASGGIENLSTRDPNRALYYSPSDSSQLEESIRAARPELQGHRSSVSFDNIGAPALLACIFFSCFVAFLCMVAMTVTMDGYGLPVALMWTLPILWTCFGCVWSWLADHPRSALCFACMWPLHLLHECGFSLTHFLLRPPEESLDAAVHTTHERTIVFEGNVLPGKETVCSWPGKYASAWDALVDDSRQDDISAAVVFLPEGSKHFGLHDPIPADLLDLQGPCWCTPLYGEPKPWGCRWWSKWIANIELAVEQGATLVVYYFNGKRGEGKVKDFSTAGQEHLRREQISRRRADFQNSEDFRKAFEAGLKHLSAEPGPDASSPFSREVHRLFLAWLGGEDRQFLEASEGLGNSQKAEVAWLERKGYPYVEKEVSEFASRSSQAMEQALLKERQRHLRIWGSWPS
ncbi:unnamed protein product [Symbiodinium natans]|uniref:Uncharacterized protein n=1 Tax=Symbiodinium natans TaxID=878477 RepID=A0A812GCL5_9DINO|nr:unnamed protein product [Symbiodinium natans]